MVVGVVVVWVVVGSVVVVTGATDVDIESVALVGITVVAFADIVSVAFTVVTLSNVKLDDVIISTVGGVVDIDGCVVTFNAGVGVTLTDVGMVVSDVVGMVTVEGIV